MNKIIVADTGPLIALALTDALPFLSLLFKQVIVPQSVFNECITNINKPGARIIIKAKENQLFQIDDVEISEEFKLLQNILDVGEADSIYLAKKLNATVLIDEARGRKVALSYGISITGSAAILIRAKQKNLISEVKPLLNKLKNHGYRMSDKLIDEILHIAKEIE